MDPAESWRFSIDSSRCGMDPAESWRFSIDSSGREAAKAGWPGDCFSAGWAAWDGRRSPPCRRTSPGLVPPLLVARPVEAPRGALQGARLDPHQLVVVRRVHVPEHGCLREALAL